jgi:pimeloyl-ACP methyl ester carboxylesterase
MSSSRAGSCAPSAPAPDPSGVFCWSHQERKVRIAISDSGGEGPAWLLLPALSTISSSSEWEPFCRALLESCQRDRSPVPRLIRVDWPGFGESERPHLPYDAELLARFLSDFRRELCPADCGLVAAGHAAGIALLAAERHGLAFRDWVLVAPTWRGPFPTMAGRQSRAFPLLRGLVEAPLIGPLLYRLNTTKAMLGWMSRRHVDVAGPGLSPEGLSARQRISHQPGARFASRLRDRWPRSLRHPGGLARRGTGAAQSADSGDRRSVAAQIESRDAGPGGGGGSQPPPSRPAGSP